MQYELLQKWQRENNCEKNFSEDVLLAYFEQEKESKKSPNTLWSCYSMIKKELNFHERINIDRYESLKGFLKTNSKGYKPKKAKKFSSTNVRDFIKNADTDRWLLEKVRGSRNLCRH